MRTTVIVVSEISLGAALAVGGFILAAVGGWIAVVRFLDWRREQRARAKFQISITPHEVEADGVVRTDGNFRSQRVAVGVKNEGDRAAGETVINVLVPSHIEYLRWCGPNGEEQPDSGSPAPASEGDLLRDGEREYPAQYLSRSVPRVGLKPGYIAYFTFQVNVPDPGKGEARVPVRAKAQADEIPEDLEEYVEERMVRVARRPN